MVEVRPFRGLRYDPDKVGGLTRVVCPPYDAISPEDERALRRRSPYNAVRLELLQPLPGDTPEDNHYTRAARLLRRWVRDGVLVRERRPAIYVLREMFEHGGRRYQRLGVVVVARLEPYHRRVVFPHENTTPKPKADRLALLRVTRTNVSPIMCLYPDGDGAVRDALDGVLRRHPTAALEANGYASYEMWVVDSPETARAVQEALKDRPLFIADGHHRYEAALEYLEGLERAGPLPSDAAARFMMMSLYSTEDPGLLLLPYHRFVTGLGDEELMALRRRLQEAYEVRRVPVPEGDAGATARALEEALARLPRDEYAVATFGLEPRRGHILTLRGALRPLGSAPALERCDVWLLHRRALSPALGAERETEAVRFTHSGPGAVAAVLEGRAQLALLLRPVSLKAFQEIVVQGHRLPPKATYFHPKVPTGIVLNPVEGSVVPD